MKQKSDAQREQIGLSRDAAAARWAVFLGIRRGQAVVCECHLGWEGRGCTRIPGDLEPCPGGDGSDGRTMAQRVPRGRVRTCLGGPGMMCAVIGLSRQGIAHTRGGGKTLRLALREVD